MTPKEKVLRHYSDKQLLREKRRQQNAVDKYSKQLQKVCENFENAKVSLQRVNGELSRRFSEKKT